MSESSTCWKCGDPLQELLLPPQQCLEPVADNVSDKQRANFCGYFQINPQAYTDPSDQAADSQQLDALFGDGTSEEATETSSSEDELGTQLDQLFKK